MRSDKTISRRNIIILSLLAGLMLFVILHIENKKPTSLDISQIEQVYIYSRSGKDMVQLTDDDMAILLQKMAGVKLIGEGTEDFKEYVGIQWKMFHFKFEDGSEMVFSAGNPFYIIDCKWGFPSNYSDCDNLSNFYYSLVKQYFSSGLQ